MTCKYIVRNEYDAFICNDICDNKNDIFCYRHMICGKYYVVVQILRTNNIQSVCFYNRESGIIRDIYHKNKWLATRGDSIYVNAFNYAYNQYKHTMPKWTTMYLIFKHYTSCNAYDLFHNMVQHYLRFVS